MCIRWVFHLISLASLLVPCVAYSVEFAIVDGVANTGTGNTDYTKSGFGTPACAMILATYGTANGTAVSHGGVAIGLTDGTNHRSLMGASEDNLATTDTGGAQNTADAFRMVTPTSQSVTDGTASGSLITDGVRLNTTDAFASAYRVKVLLIGGAGVAGCKVGSVDTNATLNATTTVNTVGFQSDVIFFASLSDTATAPNNNMLSMGVYVRDGSNTQAALSLNDDAAAGTSALSEMLTTSRVLRRVVSGSAGAAAEISNVTSSGFDVTTRSATAQSTLNYLAIDLSSSIGVKLITDASPTATGNESITGIGFKPQFGFGIYGTVLANDTHYTDGDAESWGLGMFTAADAACVGMTSDDGVSPSNTESLTDTQALCLQKDGALFQAATLSSFDADGATFNHSTANGTSRQRIFLFVQEGATPPAARRREVVMFP